METNIDRSNTRAWKILGMRYVLVCDTHFADDDDVELNVLGCRLTY